MCKAHLHDHMVVTSLSDTWPFGRPNPLRQFGLLLIPEEKGLGTFVLAAASFHPDHVVLYRNYVDDHRHYQYSYERPLLVLDFLQS